MARGGDFVLRWRAHNSVQEGQSHLLRRNAVRLVDDQNIEVGTKDRLPQTEAIRRRTGIVSVRIHVYDPNPMHASKIQQCRLFGRGRLSHDELL
jgi:hypothetical protein